MKQMATRPLSHKSLYLLSRLLLQPRTAGNSDGALFPTMEEDVCELTQNEFDDLVAVAETHHVLMRGVGVFKGVADQANDKLRAGWAEARLSAERARIDRALTFLSAICDTFTRQQLPVAVIKSLDHLPDIGSDLDLYTDAKPDDVIRLMQHEFDAHVASRSWGDRLACKWNFILPGLPEFVEIHVGRLGQTGEQCAIASSLLGHTQFVPVCGRVFRAAGVSDRLMISTLQRMYRHFYFRLCDIVDSAGLVESENIDWSDLYRVATAAGIWDGVATYIAIVSDYVNRYRGVPLEIPQWILASARFGGKDVYFANDFLRVPLLPQSAMLYGTQLAAVIRRRQIESGARLSLLPWLATAALLGQKITGSDKGVW